MMTSKNPSNAQLLLAITRIEEQLKPISEMVKKDHDCLTGAVTEVAVLKDKFNGFKWVFGISIVTVLGVIITVAVTSML